MGASVRAVGTAGTAVSATSVTATCPAAAQPGDLLMLFVGSNSDASNGPIPAGWTRHRPSGAFKAVAYSKYAVAGDASKAFTVTFNGPASYIATIVAYQNPLSATPIDASRADQSSTNSVTTGSVTTTRDGELIVEFAASADPEDAFAAIGTVPATWRAAADVAYVGVALADQVQAAAGPTSAQTFSSFGKTIEALTFAIKGNSPPNAPSLTAPATGATLDLNTTNRFAYSHSDPDGDSASKSAIRYRLVGAATWTTVTLNNPNTYWDAPAGTFAAGDYEWQAQTWDAQGAEGPFSSAGFFTAAATPPGPAIIEPTNGSTVGLSTAQFTWSTANQDVYQVQVLDGATVVSDTGEVANSAARSLTLTFPTNNVTRVLQVRVKYAGLWSPWTAVTVNVSYTPPAAPIVTLTTDTTEGRLLVGCANPAPGAGVPAVSYNDVYVTDPGKLEERRATQLATNSTWVYWTPASSVDYSSRVRVVAVGTNGTTASS